MESRRRTVLVGALAAVAAALGAFWPGPAAASRIWRVGFLDVRPRGDANGMAQGFVNAMTKLGYVEGKNIEYLHPHVRLDPALGHLANARQLAALADELVRARPDAIVTRGTAATRALARATTTIPIVTNVGDPVGAGFARSIARPGGNITGLAQALREMYEKTFEHLKAIIPGTWSLAQGVGGHPPEMEPFFDTIAEAARSRGIPVRRVDFKGMDAAQADRVLASMRGQGVRVLDFYSRVDGVSASDALMFAKKYGLVSLPSHVNQVPKGALLMYVSIEDNILERQAMQLARILRGTPPGEIPFDTSRKFGLALNRGTAALLGYTIPREILLAADEVFD